ncbi:MAG: hypothetical protein IT383_16280 [Deltaproteobacteria bacterium]|nr:hypothetical protein [Deltaproteobacteria bacterium]
MTANRLLPALGLVVVVVAGLTLWRAMGRRPPPPPPALVDAGASPPVAMPIPNVRVAKADGMVEVRRQGSDLWQELSAGAVLAEDDAIRTGAGASVELEAGGHTVTMLAGTDVKVAELTADLTRYLLGSGLLAGAAPGAAGRTLQVDVEGTDVAVRASDGSFRMSSNGAGTVAVAAQEGDVRVAAKGKEVVLKKGERSLVLPGGTPSDAAPLASSLLLKVAWPKQRETNKRVVTITGRSEAGALVFALGRPLKVGADGSFKESLALPEGESRLEVSALDVSGNARREAGPSILVDSKGASSRFQTDDLWKSK